MKKSPLEAHHLFLSKKQLVVQIIENLYLFSFFVSRSFKQNERKNGTYVNLH